MFAYAKNMQLALSDKLRRTGLAAGAGVVLTLGAGFLLAALWTYLADHLGWGPLFASLAIGSVLVVVGLIFLLMARSERHPVPSTDDLRLEVEQQLNLAANAAINKVSDAADSTLERAASKASAILDLAEHKVHAVSDDLGYRANRMADRAEARVYGAARHAGEATAQKLGLGSMLGRGGEDGRASKLATVAPLLGALAVGVTLASRFQDRRHRDEEQG